MSWNTSVATIAQAQRHFTAALERDDGFARAHAGLCDTHLASYRQNQDPIPFVLAQKSCNQALLASTRSIADSGKALWEYRVQRPAQTTMEQFLRRHPYTEEVPAGDVHERRLRIDHSSRIG